MTTLDQRPVADAAATDIDEISASIDRFRAGELSEDVALDAIARVVRRRGDRGVATYQKLWG